MAVEISGTVSARGVSRRRLARKALAILEAIDLGACELSVVLTDDDEIRRLNREYRGRDRPTDVLSFPLREGEFADVGDALGDVVISIPTARRQAAEIGFGLEEEVDRLLIHGILHLAGYDHEVSPREARRMQRQERRMRSVLARLGGADERSKRRTAKPGSRRVAPRTALRARRRPDGHRGLPGCFRERREEF